MAIEAKARIRGQVDPFATDESSGLRLTLVQW
jgi:hypothetical protein